MIIQADPQETEKKKKGTTTFYKNCSCRRPEKPMEEEKDREFRVRV